MTEIIDDLNFTKSRGDSHVRNPENKVNGENQYKKPLFLFEIFFNNFKNPTVKSNLITYINLKLNLNINDIAKNKFEIEIFHELLMVNYCICKIIENIESYRNYLFTSIEHIKVNHFHLNKQIFTFNDTLDDKIVYCYDETILKNKDLKDFTECYFFKNFFIDAIDNKSKCMSTEYRLCFSKDNKWNVFPSNSDDKDRFVSNNIFKNMIATNKKYDEEGICFINEELIEKIKKLQIEKTIVSQLL
jgi:hypothetical protein